MCVCVHTCTCWCTSVTCASTYIFLQHTQTHTHTHTHTHVHMPCASCLYIFVVRICSSICTTSLPPPLLRCTIRRYISSLFCAMIFKEAWTQGLCLWSTVTRRFLLLVPMCGWTRVQSAIHPRQVFRMDFLSIYVHPYVHTFVHSFK